MPYNIRRFQEKQQTPGTVSHTVKDFNLDETYSTLPFIGKYYEDYQTAIGESMLWLTERFASENPPEQAIRGQIWFNRNDETLYFFNHPDGTDSTNLSNWDSFVSNVSEEINNHLNDFNNPHLVTKQTIGLGNVDNVFVYDKSLNFGEYTNSTLTPTDLLAAQTNLSVYSTEQQYSKTSANATFFPINGVAVNSNSLDGVVASGYMSISTPNSTSGITNTSTSESDLISANNSGQSIHFSDSQGGDLSLFSGIGKDFKTVVSNDGGVRLSLQTKNVSPVATVKLYSQGVANSTPSVIGTLQFDSTNISVNGNTVFHEGNLPTTTQVGALALSATAQNTHALNGKTQTTNATQNQIALRDSSGILLGSTFSSTSTSEGNSISSSGSILFRNTSVDPLIRYASKSDVQNWINANAFLVGAKHWAMFDNIGTIIDGYNCTITKTGTGQYRINFTGTSPTTTNYCVITKIDDSGSIVADGPSNTLDCLEVGVDRTAPTTSYASIFSSLTQATKISNGSGGYTAQFRSVYTDAVLYAVGIFY